MGKYKDCQLWFPSPSQVKTSTEKSRDSDSYVRKLYVITKVYKCNMIVSNASTLILLAKVSVIRKFLDEYGEITIPNEVEKEVQGAASPTDTFVSTFGGVVEIPSRKRLELLDCGIVIGNTNKGASPKKTAKLVQQVARLKEQYPDAINPIIKTIGSFAKQGEALVSEKNYTSLGKLMNVNHGLLDALGVCTVELSALVYAARNAGAYGAKLTGAGGGGCMVALSDSPQEVAKAIERAGGQAIITRFTQLGVLLE